MNPNRALTWLAVALIVKVTLSVLIAYRDYFPANFESNFLHGRESYFHGGYQVAFYTHLFAGPATLMLGLVLLSGTFRTHFPRWHRRVGKSQIAIILLLLAPSGLWMAQYADGGSLASIGFSALAIVTGACAALGWRSAARRQFAEHQEWMWRCYLLLCSAIVIRMIGGLVTVTGVGVDWSYPLAAWMSWLGPLAVYEVIRLSSQRLDRRSVHGASGGLSSALSLPAAEMSARR